MDSKRGKNSNYKVIENVWSQVKKYQGKADDSGQMNTPELQKMLLSELQKNDLVIFSKYLENIRSDKKKKWNSLVKFSLSLMSP